jgi:integrase
MSVRKRKWTTRSGEAKEAWVVDYAQDGRRHIETFKRKKDADAYAQQVGVDIRAGTHTPPSRSITVAEAADDWVASGVADKLEPATIAQYRQLAHHITGRIGKLRLANLTAKRATGFREELLTSMSGVMARKVLVAFRSLLRDAQRRGSVAQNVALSLKRINVGKRGEKKLRIGVDIPSMEEIRAILAAAPERWRPLLLTAIFTGLRSSELRGLRWEDIDLKAGELHVRQRADRYNVIGAPKSKAGHRTVPLGPEVRNVLREWKLRCPRSELGLVFPNSGGGILRHSDIVRVFKSVVRAAGVTVPVLDKDGKPAKDDKDKPLVAPKYTGLHTLRHFYASWCINPEDRGGQALPPKVVQERLGHSSIVMTLDTYGHLFPRGDDADKLAKAERALLGAT